MNMATKRELVLITGASTGIGAALAQCFAKGGFDLVLVARSADKLALLAENLRTQNQVQVWVEPFDLSVKSSVKKLATSLKKQQLDVDVLVNNAGVLEHGPFVRIDPVRQLGMIELNVLGLTAMLNQFVPGMVERGHGRVLNVASIAAFQPLPGLATYAATKAYVLSLSEALAEELKSAGVSVTALCPGITETNMMTAAQQQNSSLQQMPAIMIGDVDDVAQEGYDACMAGEAIRVPGTLNLAATLLARATPKWLVRRVTGVMGRLTT